MKAGKERIEQIEAALDRVREHCRDMHQIEVDLSLHDLLAAEASVRRKIVSAMDDLAEALDGYWNRLAKPGTL